MQILTWPGRTSLDADLQVLARHAAPADRRVYVKCLRMYRAVCPAPSASCLVAKHAGVLLPHSVVLQQAAQKRRCCHSLKDLAEPR